MQRKARCAVKHYKRGSLTVIGLTNGQYHDMSSKNEVVTRDQLSMC